jgi:hypothetical protein
MLTSVHHSDPLKILLLLQSESQHSVHAPHKQTKAVVKLLSGDLKDVDPFEKQGKPEIIVLLV